MSGLSVGPLMVDAILAITLLEGVALTVLWRRMGRGVEPGRLWPNLLAGIALLLAVRAVQAGASWLWLAACLAGAGLAHLVDLRRRWR